LWPSNCTVPLSFCSVPQMQLTSVLLPEPFGPISPSRSPGCTSIHRGSGLAGLGTSIVSTPLLKRAVMLSACTSSGSAIRRW